MMTLFFAASQNRLAAEAEWKFFAALPVYFAVFAAPRNRYAAVLVQQPATR